MGVELFLKFHKVEVGVKKGNCASIFLWLKLRGRERVSERNIGLMLAMKKNDLRATPKQPTSLLALIRPVLIVFILLRWP